MTISAVILTKNEEKNIDDCLKSLSWCNELIVVDDNSQDKTIEISKKYHVKIFTHLLENNFSKQRNFGLSKATSDWVLFIDADERVSQALALEIESRIKNRQSRIQGYYIQRIDAMWGKILQHGEQGNMWLLRLAKKNAGKWVRDVHEVWQIQDPTEKLSQSLLHFPHPTVADFLSEINFYSTLRAKELYAQSKNATIIEILLFPKVKFIYNYVIRLGFLDGIEGFIVAILMSFYSFLVRGKLWQLNNK